ncbi:MAG: Holliday junction branch migration protein RuvA [Planctomycetota bacterium]|jgi:Holliday junction DNA helicase RuvA
MFDSITGTLVRKDPGGVVVSVGGVGYALHVPLRTWQHLPPDEEITLYCHLAVRDDSMQLYGFQHPAERDLFLKIMSVSGVGAATALNVLSDITPREFLEAIARENVTLLQRVKKIGARTAKRLVLELKGKLDLEGMAISSESDSSGIPQALEESKTACDLIAALLALGYPRAAAREAASKALASHPDEEKLESLLRSALRQM